MTDDLSRAEQSRTEESLFFLLNPALNNGREAKATRAIIERTVGLQEALPGALGGSSRPRRESWPEPATSARSVAPRTLRLTPLDGVRLPAKTAHGRGNRRVVFFSFVFFFLIIILLLW